VAIAGPASVKALQSGIDLVTGYQIAPPPASTEYQMFYKGKSGMFFHYSWNIDGLRQTAAFEWDVLPIPNADAVPGNMVLGGLFMIDNYTKQAEAAWELLKYLTSEKVQQRIAREASVFFPRKSFFAGNVYAQPGAPPYNWTGVGEAYNVSQPYPMVANLDRIRSIISGVVGNAFNQRVTPEAALADAARQIKDLL
jgi:multiple sugar transport system substrate-binding protein